MSLGIVLADDHEIVLKGLESVLSAESGFKILGKAKGGYEAIELARKHLPDVIVIDIGLPDIDGIEATRQITAISPDTKILALSVYSERDYVVEMFRAGASGYLLKDDALVELLKAIRLIVSGKRYLSDDLVDIMLQDLTEEPASESGLDLSRLTSREREILRLVLNGDTIKEIAFALNLSPKTVHGHRQQIMKKLEVDNMIELTKLAIREGIIEP